MSDFVVNNSFRTTDEPIEPAPPVTTVREYGYLGRQVLLSRFTFIRSGNKFCIFRSMARIVLFIARHIMLTLRLKHQEADERNKLETPIGTILDP